MWIYSPRNLLHSCQILSYILDQHNIRAIRFYSKYEVRLWSQNDDVRNKQNTQLTNQPTKASLFCYFSVAFKASHFVLIVC